ncbi:MAG: hypothetical protein AVDCRST_MAG41-2457 [uncultured Corynebacteriales bacterium]|uniref:Uncharacterized protein n=1 Tax=uncultured Mycobacteriales bacterium TaxID=581187 RepID=A0A6J4IY07_9ACTN|nr:MAG: hypothetical protein AVDCRST_MAG41-2457 [uncultured Corynebacteriales bacterium]
MGHRSRCRPGTEPAGHSGPCARPPAASSSCTDSPGFVAGRAADHRCTRSDNCASK